MPEYIFDTTVLSNFAAVGRLDLLRTRYRDRAYTTVQVGDELHRGVNAGYPYLEPLLTTEMQGWLRLLSPDSAQEQHLCAEFNMRLDPGEASCLALALSRGFVLATDDLAARQLARQTAVPVTGTLGVLVALVRDDSLPLAEANAILAQMIQQRYRSPVDCLNGLI